jgi:hydroxymethylpyrimidine pyrophosphatase-like HAD family hydrolase
MFFTDLDRTIIFSKRFLNGENRELVVPVEEKEGRHISYMNPVAFMMLTYLRRQVPFVPVTARKLDEIMRVIFIRDNMPEWMICESGRVIYHNGKRWEEWDKIIEKELEVFMEDIIQSQNYFRYLLEDKYLVKTWHINPDMVMGKTEGMSQDKIGELQSYDTWFKKRHCLLYLQQRKAYLIPTPISKSKAVEYLIQLLKPSTHTVSAGDAQMDAGMFEKTDFAIAPCHHTIDDVSVPVTQKTGIDAGEELIMYAMEKLYLS